jgi:RNase P/RNase MRP subunit p29
VASRQTGQLTLLDGSAAEVAARVQVARPGTQFVAVQQGVTGFAVDQAAGSVVRVDGRTFEVRPGSRLLPGARRCMHTSVSRP